MTFSSPTNHPFLKLRKAIRESGKQFRRNNDNSESLFHPEGGFEYAYDIPLVEDALLEYEQSLPKELREEGPPVSLEEQIMRSGQMIVATHPSMDARDFARTVMAYLTIQSRESGKSPLTLIEAGPPEEDELEE